MLVTGLVVGVVVVAGALYAYASSRRSSSAGVDASSPSANGSINAVAVIPFVNTGGNPQDEYFSDGMTDELAHALSRVPRLTVAGRSSAYAFKGKTLPAQEIGKALNVNAVIEGSVRRAGRRLRVIAQLTSARSGQVMWSDSFESSASDLFQVQDDFTKAIVGALTPTLGVETAAHAASSSRGTDDQTAYDLYLKGRFFFAKRGAPAVKRAIGYFSEAAARDPKFARARAGLSMAFSVLGVYDGPSADSSAPLALKNAQLAVALDSSLGDAHLALANALSYSSRLNEADVEFQRALKLQPEDATTHQWNGDNLEMLGRAKEALAEEQRAAALDPLSAIIAHEVAYALFQNRRFDEALRASQLAITLDSTLVLAQFQLVLNHVFGGHPEKAVPLVEQFYARGIQGGLLVFTYAAAGRWEDASKFYRISSPVLKRGTERGAVLMHLIAGDNQKALDIFEGMTRHGLHQTPFGCDPTFQLLHNEPRFIAVMRRYGAGICPATTPWPVKPPPAGFALSP
jgi:TolB-like protein/tetratricopeptide (TPR) repeat protein